MKETWVVKTWLLEPANLDAQTPFPAFMNLDGMEQVETGCFGPFDSEDEADAWVGKARPLLGKTQYVVIALDDPKIIGGGQMIR